MNASDPLVFDEAQIFLVCFRENRRHVAMPAGKDKKEKGGGVGKLVCR